MKIYSLILALLVSSSVFAQSRVEDTGNMIVSAVTEYNEGNRAKASAILQKIVEMEPSNDAAWYYLALCSVAEKDVEMAEVRFRKAVELDPGNFWYRYRLAAIYAMTSRPELTTDIYEKLLKDFPKKSELYFDLAELYSAQGENEKALETLKEIETVFGITESVAVYRFNLLMRMQRQEEAYKSLEEYNDRYSSPYVLATLAEHQLSMYNDSTALAYYDEALDIAPDYAPALLGKAETLRMTRKYGEYFKVLDDFVSNPSDVAKSKTDYLSAVIQRSDPKFIRTFIPQMDG
ncbi:MAG: tetratricopeptide repeat protein, partial [Bacteroidales bacterium]|nr:tetratricopeptide repeat protein [Bacteroidales bacterium]